MVATAINQLVAAADQLDAAEVVERSFDGVAVGPAVTSIQAWPARRLDAGAVLLQRLPEKIVDLALTHILGEDDPVVVHSPHRHVASVDDLFADIVAHPEVGVVIDEIVPLEPI